MGVRSLRHDHPDRLAVHHQVADPLQAGHRHCQRRTVPGRNLNYFDAIFFFGVREADLDRRAAPDLLSFVRDDGKGFVATHAGATGFFSWPEFGEMLGGRFDEHPWGISEATVVVEDATSPMTKHLPKTFAVTDEHYQLKEFSRSKLHVLARLDASKLDLKAPLVHRTDADFPVAWTKTYGKGRVFYSTLGHPRELWDTPWLQTMYFEALKWAMASSRGEVEDSPRHGRNAVIVLAIEARIDLQGQELEAAVVARLDQPPVTGLNVAERRSAASTNSNGET